MPTVVSTLVNGSPEVLLVQVGSLLFRGAEQSSPIVLRTSYRLSLEEVAAF